MLTDLIGGLLLASCLGCSDLAMGPRAEPAPVVENAVAPVRMFGGVDADTDILNGIQLRAPIQLSAAFGPESLSGPGAAGRVRALDLSVPAPIRAERSESLSAEMAFGGSRDLMGVGFDFEVAPRAQIQRNRAGKSVANLGYEVRLGRGLAERDQRGADVAAPSWYFYVGADSEALVWNLADRRSMAGVTLRDQVTVGDLQLGVAWTTALGGQMSAGVVERKFSYVDLTGDRDVSQRERFAALSYTRRW